jgi:hypothetical protein
MIAIDGIEKIIALLPTSRLARTNPILDERLGDLALIEKTTRVD